MLERLAIVPVRLPQRALQVEQPLVLRLPCGQPEGLSEEAGRRSGGRSVRAVAPAGDQMVGSGGAVGRPGQVGGRANRRAKGTSGVRPLGTPHQAHAPSRSTGWGARTLRLPTSVPYKPKSATRSWHFARVSNCSAPILQIPTIYSDTFCKALERRHLTYVCL